MPPETATGRAGGPPPASLALLMSARHIGSRERLFLALAENLASAGTRVEILACTPSQELKEAAAPTITVTDLDRFWTRPWPHVVRMYLSPGPLARFCLKSRPDVLFATSIPPNLAACRAVRSARAQDPALTTKLVLRQSNVVFNPQDPEFSGIRRRPRDRFLEGHYREADAVIANSESVARNLAGLGLSSPGQVSVIPNGVDLKVIERAAMETPDHPWLAGTRGPDHGPVLVAVGRLVPKKDYPTLIDAFARLRRTRPTARLIVLGDGPERGRLEGQLRQLGLADAVSLPGFEANPHAFLARADLFVSASISEGMASAPIEALAAGAPVVSTDHPGGAAEVLGGGAYGRLVPVGDADALAGAMDAALSDAPAPARNKARAAAFGLKAAVGAYAEALGF